MALAASRRGRAVVAALTAVLLASCSVSTGDPIELSSPSFAAGSGSVAETIALADTAPAADTSAAVETRPLAEAPTEVTATADEIPSQPTIVMDADDSELPTEVAYVPALKPGAALAAASEARAEAQPGADATAEPAPPTIAGAPAAPQPAPAQPKPQKRGFLAGLFDNSAYPPVEQDDYRGQPRAQRAAAPARAPAPVEPEQAPVDVAMATPVEAPQAPAAAEPASPTPAETVTAPQPTAFIESGPGPTPPAQKAEKKGFLSGFFSNNPSDEPERRPMVKREVKPRPVVTLASTGPVATPRSGGQPLDALPGVRQSALFEITRKSGMDDDDDIDLHEDEGPVRVASAAGLARLAPNGLLKQTDHVDVACLKPSLVRVLKTVERHYGKQVVVTSGYRSPSHNRRARGARNSLHMYCAAADVQVPGVTKWELAKFVRSMSGRGGVGTYCHTESVHIDVGPERDWNWRCRKRKS
jgi:uncharacterized protein YcbK (DUF882 family)